jgi:hypothetical protein
MSYHDSTHETVIGEKGKLETEHKEISHHGPYYVPAPTYTSSYHHYYPSFTTGSWHNSAHRTLIGDGGQLATSHSISSHHGQPVFVPSYTSNYQYHYPPLPGHQTFESSTHSYPASYPTSYSAHSYSYPTSYPVTLPTPPPPLDATSYSSSYHAQASRSVPYPPITHASGMLPEERLGYFYSPSQHWHPSVAAYPPLPLPAPSSSSSSSSTTTTNIARSYSSHFFPVIPPPSSSAYSTNEYYPNTYGATPGYYHYHQNPTSLGFSYHQY